MIENFTPNIGNIFTDITECSSIKVVEKEIFRYLGIPHDFILDLKNRDLLDKIKNATAEMQNLLLPKAVFCIHKIKQIDNNKIFFDTFCITSNDLSKNLKNCEYITILAGTIGPRIDLLIQKYTKLDIGYASILQAIGAMFIESYIDKLNSELEYEFTKKGFLLKPRFSPGYGDLELKVQKDIFKILNPQAISLSLMESLIMAPEKSVTAFIGAYKI